MSDPISEFIAYQLHSASNIDAGMMPKRLKGKKAITWWPYQHHRTTKTFSVHSHEDRLIAAIDKSRKWPKRSRQDEVEDLLEKGYRKNEIAERLNVSQDTITRDVKKLRRRLKLCLDNSKK